jgi:transposase
MSKINKNRYNEVVRVGIDTSKKHFQIHGVNAKEQVVIKKAVTRNKFVETIVQLPKCEIGIEACGASHHWARTFEKMGHKVKLIPAAAVKGYLHKNKNDANDAAAICEAISRPNIKFVSVKTIRQQDIQALHRVREDIVKSRSSLAKQIRGLLAEYGVVIPKGIWNIRGKLGEIMGDAENGLTIHFRETLDALYEAFKGLDERSKKIEKRIEQSVKEDELPNLLMTIPGIGKICSSAIVAAVGNGRQFKTARDMAAWCGLVPSQFTTGGKVKLLGISKKGNRYLRKILIAGARAVVTYSKSKTDKVSLWIQSLVERCGFNKAVVAVANKNMRIAWAILKTKEPYRTIKVSSK